MPQKPLDASDDTVRLTLRLTKSQTHAIDQFRGPLSRSAYLRKLIDLSLAQPRVVVETGTQAMTRLKIQPMERHLHRFKQGDVVGYQRGVAVHHYECECGATKEDS